VNATVVTGAPESWSNENVKVVVEPTGIEARPKPLAALNTAPMLGSAESRGAEKVSKATAIAT
jgi:hypothetical protein